MKTPRDILLERNRHVSMRLNAVRHKALGQIQEPHRFSARIRQFIWQTRWHLAGMSAAWAIIFVLNAGSAHDSPFLAASASDAATPQMLTALKENRRQLLEMLRPADRLETSSPHTAVPGKRTINSEINRLV